MNDNPMTDDSSELQGPQDCSENIGVLKRRFEGFRGFSVNTTQAVQCQVEAEIEMNNREYKFVSAVAEFVQHIAARGYQVASESKDRQTARWEQFTSTADTYFAYTVFCLPYQPSENISQFGRQLKRILPSLVDVHNQVN